MAVPDPCRVEWFTSSHSNNGGNCVEVALLGGGLVAVRDSKNRAGPVLMFQATRWRMFVAGVRTGRFDRAVPDWGPNPVPDPVTASGRQYRSGGSIGSS